jgi:ribonuclease Y
MSFITILGLIAVAGVGCAAGYLVPISTAKYNLMASEKRLVEVRQKAEEIKKGAAEQTARMKKAFEEEERSMHESLSRLEEAIAQKEDIIKRREDRNHSYEKNVEDLREEVKTLLSGAEKLVKDTVEKLTQASGLTEKSALELARKNIGKIVLANKEIRQKAELEEYEEDIMRHATAVLQLVVQRLGVQSSVDKNTTSVQVKEDKFKGLLAGKEGKNIKYFEELLPVSVIFNLGDAKTIYVGGLNLFRRNIGKRAIEKLQKLAHKKGRIDHPMIKDAVEEAEKELMAEADRKGEWALKEVGLDPKTVDKEVVNLMGRLYFRTSYGQNVLYHSLEMAHAARVIAELIGADPDLAMQATFYHDIGKAIDHETEGASHDELTKEILEKHGYDPELIYSAFGHHDKVPSEKAEDFIVMAADAISGGRPGSRQESLASYLERIKQLEGAAKSFEGVSKVYTMSAGREVRVIVNRDQVQDENMQALADGVAGKISEEVSFPGIIKVNLIRLTKAVDYARDKMKK